jgi:hypothetical protein
MINLKLILFYLIGFTIFYLEPIPMGGLTFGIIWKLILMFILFLPVLYKTLKSKHIEMFAFVSILFAFKILLSYSSMDYLMETLTVFFKALMFPMLYLFFINKFQKSTLVFLAKHLAILIILIFIPYILGILEPLNEGYKLEAYGLEGQYGLIGPFIRPHTASISISFSMIIITSHIKRENSKLLNLLYISLLFLGFYELLSTYVRTGLAIYLLILLYMYIQEINLKKIMLILLSTLILGAGSLYLIATNEVVQMRLKDQNKYDKSGDVGSGRVIFWKTAVESWMHDESSVIFIGLGEEYAKDKMEKVTGMRIFAHNEFVQMLQQEGLVGVILFISFLYLIHKFISRHKNSVYYLTAKIIFIGILLEMMLQGGFYFNMVLFLSIYLALLKIEYLENLDKEEQLIQKKAQYV